MRRLLLSLILLAACSPERERSPGTPSHRSDGGPRNDAGDGSVLDAAFGDGGDRDASGSQDVPLGIDVGFADGGGFADAAPPFDSGPPGPPGPTGIEHFCIRYFECGGTFYSSPQDCVSQGLGYWGTCSTRRAALDAFSECMAGIPCTDYDPNAYNPASTPCAALWSALQATPPC